MSERSVIFMHAWLRRCTSTWATSLGGWHSMRMRCTSTWPARRWATRSCARRCGATATTCATSVTTASPTGPSSTTSPYCRQELHHEQCVALFLAFQYYHSLPVIVHLLGLTEAVDSPAGMEKELSIRWSFLHLLIIPSKVFNVHHACITLRMLHLQTQMR